MQNLNHLLRPATPVKDAECRRLIANLRLDEYLSNFEANLDISNYYQEFLSWLQGSRRVELRVPSSFEPFMCSGVTEGFHDFYIRHSQRQLFVLRGEYPYHKDVWHSLARPLMDLDTEALHTQACVILSAPFSATGALSSKTKSILEDCSRLDVPVFLDLAFLGLGASFSVNDFLHYSCVESFSFSFSKMFAMGRMRAGWCWTRSRGGALKVLDQWKYNNWLGHYVALHCLRHFSFDYMCEKYAPLQKRLCADLSLQPSESFLFGLGGAEYDAYSRQGIANRVCLSNLLAQNGSTVTHRALDSSPEST